MNFHLKDGIYFRSEDTAKIRFVKATDFTDPGETLVEMSVDEFASIVSSFSPQHEQNGSWDYIKEFLQDGVMHCGGCGCKLRPGDWIAGRLSIVRVISCKPCFENKFKPLFDWGQNSRG